MNTQNLTRSFKMIGLKLKKNAPQIMVAAGVVGAVTGAVLACRGTLKLEDTLDKAKKANEEVKEAFEGEEDTTEYKKAITVQTAKNAWEIFKLYAPAVGVEVASLGLIIGANGIHYRRNASLAAAYTTLQSMYGAYRKNVKEAFGDDVDRDMRFGITHDKEEVIVTDENGKQKKQKINVDTVHNDICGYSDYAKFFDESCRNWDPNPEYSLLYLKGVQAWCNNKLMADGYVFLNDVYKELGIEPTLAGQSVGWIYDESNPVGDNYIDFGIYDQDKKKVREFVNGTENVILLDFNVDGDILSSPLLKMWKH